MIDAIGYLRSDISGSNQRQDELQLREYARVHRYNLRKIIVFGPRTDTPSRRLANILSHLDEVEAVIVPSLRHLEHAELPILVVPVMEPGGLTMRLERAAQP